MAEATKKLKQRPYDVALVATSIPYVSGIEHIELLSQNYPDMAVVVLTDQGDDTVTKQCLASGYQDYLPAYLVNTEIMFQIATHAIGRKLVNQQVQQSTEEISQLLARVEQENRQYSQMSKTDELTSLPNKTHFNEVLWRSINTAERLNKSLGVLYFDLNGFKMINDTFGHAAGDVILVGVASRLRSALRKTDFVARIHGDEFVVLTDLLEDSVQSYSVARKIESAFEAPFDIQGHEVFVSASVGIATFPEVATAHQLIECADHAMYDAKKNRSHFASFYSKRLHDESLQKRAVEDELKRALSQSQLSAQFQQIVAQARGVSGLEVFCRWNHSEIGPVAPSSFVPVADSMNRSFEISKQMLTIAALASETVFSQSSNFFAINLSQKQITTPDFTKNITSLVSELGTDPQRICFEIAERDVIDECIAPLEQLKANSFKIGLSNFGSVHASMKLMAQIRWDYVKLDKSLVVQLPCDDAHKVICESIIRLAHALDIEVIAEGVETPQERSVLLNLGCDHFQGFLLGAPFSLPL